MLKFFFSIIAWLLVSALGAQNSTRLEIKSLPPYHTTGTAVYAAGSFNGWNPQDERYKFRNDDKGNYFFELKLDPGKYEYKITRGGWDKVECKTGGAAIENRLLKVENDKTVELTIEEWKDHFPAGSKLSTASNHVIIMDTAFLIPNLNRTRRVWIYLPPSYNNGMQKKYPVIYMQDGQNIFDESTSFSGEWGVDEYLDTAQLKECIVVGIDNGGEKRRNEYNPYDNSLFGKGEGDSYLDFLVKTLIPFIGKEFRVLKNKENTFIAGSSMGGLISLYAVLKFPKVFGGAGVFSPAFWISGTKIYDDIKSKGGKVKAKIYFYGGKLEGENMVPDMQRAYEEMAKVSKSKMITVIRDEGKHNETAWRKEFPFFYEWINPKAP
ncbi:MAG: alpha/beta hydrolase [Chitinophagaceae bacterium]|nr:alpha/beta hydrolase [Chitinophagaceae bacterium]